jgi:hypothetical protein
VCLTGSIESLHLLFKVLLISVAVNGTGEDAPVVENGEVEETDGAEVKPVEEGEAEPEEFKPSVVRIVLG